MLLPLFIVQYVGEEAIFAIKSYEMHIRGDLLHPSILGKIWPHSPLFHWPIIAIASLIGWEHMDFATRLVSVFASWASAIVAALFARRLLPEAGNVIWLTVLVYLCIGEVAFWYGWLGYVDAAFGCIIFSATAALWIAFEEKSLAWLSASLLLITLAFLVKNITAYALFGLAGLAMAAGMKRWRFVFSPSVIALSVVTLAFPLLFSQFISYGGGNTEATVTDTLRYLQGYGFGEIVTHLLTFPFVFLQRALPMSLLLIWIWWRGDRGWLEQERTTSATTYKPAKVILLILLAELAPYWISPGATPRYLTPLYGWVALLTVIALSHIELRQIRTALKVIVIVLFAKAAYAAIGLPYARGWSQGTDLKSVAAEILDITRGHPVRTLNDVSTGISVAAYMDARLPESEYIHWYNGNERGVYILAEKPEPELGKEIRKFPLRGNTLYLYWQE